MELGHLRDYLNGLQELPDDTWIRFERFEHDGDLDVDGHPVDHDIDGVRIDWVHQRDQRRRKIAEIVLH